MGRAWLIGIVALMSIGSLARAQVDEMLAARELDRYLTQMYADGGPDVEVVIDPALARARDAGGAEVFSIAPLVGGGFEITGSNRNMAVHGAYHLLDLLGCRFLAPQFAHYRGAAEIIPAKRSACDLKLATPILRKPKLKFRKLYVEEGHSHDAESLKQLVEWMPKVGYNTLVIPTDYAGSGRVRWDNWRKELTPELQMRGITIEVGGHGYENFINAKMEDGKLFERHPEWFAASEKGERVRNKNHVFCTSNPAAVEYVTTNVIAYLKDRPEINIFDFWPPDGARWCACDNCKKLGEPPDRQAILLKQVQDKLKPVRPDLRLEIIAYSSYLEPPKKVAVDKNVLVDFCPISQHFDAQINDPANKNKTYADALQAWRKSFQGDISIYSYYRKYAWDSLPVIIPRYMQKDLQWYATLPTQGVSVYSEPGDWFTYELNHYVLAALAWDENVDVEKLIEKFCAARYGDEAAVARKTFDALERIVRVYCSVPHVPLKDAAPIAAAHAELQALTNDLSTAAARAGRAKDESVRRNLDRLGLMCTYALRDLEIQKLRASNAPRAQIVEKATSLHAWVKSHADDGVFLIKNQRLNLNRMLTRYGVGEAKKTAVPE
ncbi:MAG: hypothetical protein QOE14_115 [Humisphaera sp.]|nr:hypothetical protein [Humisphaera sp.]